MFQEQGKVILLKLAQALEDIGTVEAMPQMEGKKMHMLITPKKKK